MANHAPYHSSESSGSEDLPDEQPMTGLSQEPSPTTKGKQERASSASTLPGFDTALLSPPTAGQLESLFCGELYNLVIAMRRNGQVRVVGAHGVLPGCLEDSIYLFGSWTEEEGYEKGPIVEMVAQLVPFLEKANVEAVRTAREYLFESYMVRKEEFRNNSPCSEPRVYMLKIVEGTLLYFDELLVLLSQPDVEPGVPLGLRHDSTV